MKVKLIALALLLMITTVPLRVSAQSNDYFANSTNLHSRSVSFTVLATAPTTGETKDEKTLETDNGKYTFSNARMKDDILFVDLDYTNKSDREQTLWTFLAFEFIFEQENNSKKTPLDTDLFNKEASEGFKPLDMETKAKPGENLKLTLALTGAKKDLPFIVQPNSTSQDPIQLVIQ